MADPSIPFTPGTPLYRQVKERIVEMIKAEPSIGGRALSDAGVANRFGVSRITVRKAIQELVTAGVLYRVQGVGTFARPHKLSEKLTLRSFLEPWASESDKMDVEIRAFEKVGATKEVAQLLNTGIGEELVYIERLRTHNCDPIAVDERYLRATDAKHLSRRDILTLSLVDYLRDQEGIAFDHGTMEIEARSASKSEAAKLGLRKDAPVLVRRVQFFASGNRPILVGSSVYRADGVTYKVDISA